MRVAKIVKNQRPVNLDLQTISFPLTAIASIVHRITGVITFFALALLIWLLAKSLSSPQGFMDVVAVLDSFLVKLILWGILTAFAYHIVGGIRHLIMDAGYCEEMESGILSAKVAFGVTGVLSLLAGVLVW